MEQCRKRISEKGVFGAFHQHQCSRKVWKDGYCKQHHPDIIAEKNAKSQAEFNRKWKEQKRVLRLRNAAPDMLAALKAVADVLSDEWPNYPTLADTITAAINKVEGDEL